MSGGGYRCPPLPAIVYEPLLRRALEEDLGTAGDLTTDAIVPADALANANLIVREAGRVAGLDVIGATFRLLDPRVAVTLMVPDGTDATAGQVVGRVAGPARSILTGERTALNVFGRLSGIATMTRDLVRLVSPHGTRVLCTRKTTPGMRALEKYAVRVGGGVNHRFGLDDAVLVKDNHIAIAGGVRPAVERVRRAVGPMVMVEVEVETLDQVREAIELAVPVILFDNMSVATLASAVALARGRATTEASGGITPENAAAIAATGVDFMSVGWLTHGARSLDVALDLVS